MSRTSRRRVLLLRSHLRPRVQNLDDYTDHLYEIDDTDHPSEIEIVNRDSDKTIRTLEYVDYWTVKKEKK